ncbi:D-amino-acid transaminase [Ammoniphilus resinae]|uniref:D-alanine aminotransferase n=1 Tax=Ammoniphilus resinae TaxID=861532 RepID=A0ABS4GRC9_9BACL|nr:D-amino-acid transaminase [Ammoniphilus resinae]MBP1932811.1 D-alanine transaminase [Ammoniphilus resinae]
MILFNDQLIRREEARVDIEDRGYQFGDGIYEVVSVYEGKIFRLEEHLQRLSYCAGEIGIELPTSLEVLITNLYKLIEVNQLVNGQIYFQVTRGYAPRNHPFPAQPKPVLTGYVTRKPRPLELMKTGVKAITLDDIRWLRCDIKSLNLLGSVLAKQKAIEQGAFEALLHRNGKVTEGSSTNLFMIKDGKIQTHPLGNLILGGITRIVILELAGQKNIPVIEEPFSLKELYAADEVFVCSTTSEVMPIITIDGNPVGNGSVGPLTRKLQELMEEMLFAHQEKVQ